MVESKIINFDIRKIIQSGIYQKTMLEGLLRDGITKVLVEVPFVKQFDGENAGRVFDMAYNGVNIRCLKKGDLPNYYGLDQTCTIFKETFNSFYYCPDCDKEVGSVEELKHRGEYNPNVGDAEQQCPICGGMTDLIKFYDVDDMTDLRKYFLTNKISPDNMVLTKEQKDIRNIYLKAKEKGLFAPIRKTKADIGYVEYNEKDVAALLKFVVSELRDLYKDGSTIVFESKANSNEDVPITWSFISIRDQIARIGNPFFFYVISKDEYNADYKEFWSNKYKLNRLKLIVDYAEREKTYIYKKTGYTKKIIDIMNLLKRPWNYNICALKESKGSITKITKIAD